jgi:hypothetical protein
MQSTLAEGAAAARLRAGIQPSIAACGDDAALAVQMELLSVLDGPAFHGSSRSRAFLRFVIEETLAGRGEALKERTIGASIMGKPSDYDTGADSTVRVRANEVRKRLAAHYDASAPKAGIRIELPLGTYVPKFTQVGERAPHRSEEIAVPPPLAFWQLAAPTLIAIFLALVAIRGGVESDDAFARFWNRALARCSQITVVLDANGASAPPAAMLEAALPIERLGDVFQLPVHVVAPDGPPQRGALAIVLSTTFEAPTERAVRIGGAMLTTKQDEHWIRLSAPSPEGLRSAVQILTSRSGFPELE